jgi:predicted transcriptional regulator
MRVLLKGAIMSEVPSTSSDQQSGSDGGSKASRLKSAKILPTDRIRFDKQFDILRAFAAKAGHERRAVTNEEVGGIVDMAASTITQVTPFFVDIGLITREKKTEKTESRGFVPASEVTAYQKAYEWDKANAAKKLAPLLSATWFTDALMPKLKFRPVNEKEAINDLAEIAAVGPEKEGNIRIVIDYMVAAGIVERDAAGILRVTSGTSPLEAAVAAPSVSDRPATLSNAEGIGSNETPTAAAMTRILEKKPPKEVRDAVLKIILYLTMGDDAFKGGDET